VLVLVMFCKHCCQLIRSTYCFKTSYNFCVLLMCCRTYWSCL